MAAIKDVFGDTRAILEPAGALAIAGLKQSPSRRAQRADVYRDRMRANMNFDRLRFVSGRRDRRTARGRFAVTIPEERGSFRRFCAEVGDRSVTEFNYRISDAAEAHVFVGIETQHRDEAAEIAGQLEGLASRRSISPVMNSPRSTFATLSAESPRSPRRGAVSLRIPRTAGRTHALPRNMRPDWNISLFHYRNHGADYGRVLVGMQVPSDDQAAFGEFLSELGYRHWDETTNPAYRLFLGG